MHAVATYKCMHIRDKARQPYHEGYPVHLLKKLHIAKWSKFGKPTNVLHFTC